MIVRLLTSVMLLCWSFLLLSFNLWMQSEKMFIFINFVCFILFEVWIWNKSIFKSIFITIFIGILLQLIIGSIFMISSTIDFRTRLVVITAASLTGTLCIALIRKKLTN